MAEYVIYAAIIYVSFFVIMFTLVCWSDGLDKDTFPMTLIVSLVFTLVTLGITTMASAGSEWVFEQPDPPAIERIDLDQE